MFWSPVVHCEDSWGRRGFWCGLWLPFQTFTQTLSTKFQRLYQTDWPPPIKKKKEYQIIFPLNPRLAVEGVCRQDRTGQDELFMNMKLDNCGARQGEKVKKPSPSFYWFLLERIIPLRQGLNNRAAEHATFEGNATFQRCIDRRRHNPAFRLIRISDWFSPSVNTCPVRKRVRKQ